MGHDRAPWDSVTFVQRFGSSLNLNPHVHVLMLDGVYADGDEAPVFVSAPPLSDQTVRQIVAALTDPDLSGGGRAAGGASAEGPAAAAVRVRRLISSAIRSLRREP